MRRHATLVVAALVAASLAAPASSADCLRTSVGITPLTEGDYRGFQGGLWTGGSNDRPPAHTALGTALAHLAVPRNAAGRPDPSGGTSVFISIGMSNTRNEFVQFVPLAQADASRHPQVRVVNAAIGGRDARDISTPTAVYWSEVDAILRGAGVTPAQVQMVWLKEAIRGPTDGFPRSAERLQGYLDSITKILKARFPNLWIVFLASRIYAGYAINDLNPEPYAYESGFSVKWLIEDQLGRTPPALDTPWLSWGPYTWADGLTPRADGFTWRCEDFNSDGVHPNPQGSLKVARMLLGLVHSDPVAKIVYERAGL